MNTIDKLSSHLYNVIIMVTHECGKTRRNGCISGNINEDMK